VCFCNIRLSFGRTLQRTHFGVMTKQKNSISAEIQRLKSEVEKQPGDSRLQATLGDLLIQSGDPEGAKQHFQIATAIDPTLHDAQLKYGNILLRQCNLTGALACFALAHVYQPQDWLRLKMALLLPPIVESMDHITILRARIEQALNALSSQGKMLIRNPPRDGGSLFYIAYFGQDDRHLYEKLAALYGRSTLGLLAIAPHCAGGRNKRSKSTRQKADSDGRIKVAFISSFFFNHSIGRLNVGLIAKLDREIFEVTVVVVPHMIDEMTETIVKSADHSVQVPRDLDKARQIIGEREFDIIVYPEIGMDITTYSLACARLAPVQCVSWGHPVTTGIANMDYFVSSDLLETAGADEHYSETLVRLGELPTYYHKPEFNTARKGRAAFGLKEGVRYYLVAQYLFKMHPEFDLFLAEILKRDPDGIVLMVHGSQRVWSALLMARFKRVFPDNADRIKFVDALPREDFLSFLSCVDVSLDIPHFNGGNTTFEALAVGTPVVTLATKFMRGRVCAAIYGQMGLSDLVAKTPTEYVDLAIRLATDTAFGKKTREAIANNIDVLFENENVIPEWERFFLRACQEKNVKQPQD